MRTSWVKCVLIFAIMFVSAYVLSKTLLVDHVDYIETQRKQIAFLTILIQHQGPELRKEAPDMIARMIQKYDQQYKNLQNEVFGFAELTSSACFFLCILLSARPFQIHKKWLFLWRGRDWRFKSLLLSFAMIAIALVLSLACYCGVVFVLKWLLSTLLWCQMPFENGIDVIIQLSQVVEAFDQILLFSKWLNVAYCLQALSVLLVVVVMIILIANGSSVCKETIANGTTALLALSLLTPISACRTVTEREAVPKRETAGGVSVVAVQYVASMSWSCLAFTDPSHFMV